MIKALVTAARFFVGLLFIFSGFIKLNDPLGFSYKLEEYFSEGVLGLPFLIPYALWLAVFLVIFEVILGVALLLGYRVKFTVWSLLLMIVFFTFLTFYSAYFEKVTDCGCFGDAIPLTPWQSFYKDVLLLVLILFLFVKRKQITPLFKGSIQTMLIVVTTLFCGWFAHHVLEHLPWLDFRPYKVGANIQEGMEIPEDAPLPVFEYRWKFKKPDGTEALIVNTGAYPSVEGEFVDVETTLIEEGYIPPIHDFSMEKEGEDFTEMFLTTDKLMIIVAYNLSSSDDEGFQRLQAKIAEAQQANYEVIGLTASSRTAPPIDIPFYFCDETALKTIVRSNPGVLVLRQGTIMQKLHHNDVDQLKF